MVSDDEEYESLEWIPPTKTVHVPVQASKESNNLTLLLWILLALLILLIVVIVVIIIYFVIRKRKSQDVGIESVEMHSGKNALGKMARTLSMHMARLHGG
jgi:heme/copper-type cytochrome/quinol oxidase subunit 2